MSDCRDTLLSVIVLLQMDKNMFVDALKQLFTWSLVSADWRSHQAHEWNQCHHQRDGGLLSAGLRCLSVQHGFKAKPQLLSEVYILGDVFAKLSVSCLKSQ